MTVTIHSILNCVLWGGLMAVGLSVLSRNRRFLCRFGAAPLAALAAAALARCCLPVELFATKEIGAAPLNRLHRMIDRAVGLSEPESWFLKTWLAVSVLGLAIWLPKYMLQLAAVQKLPTAADSRILRFCKGNGLCGLRVVVEPEGHTPCVIGFWRETILLPDAGYSQKQLDLILYHEYVHIRHHDGLLDFALCLLCVLFWWNPGVVIIRAVTIRLCDHRCDMETLRSASPSGRRFYCRTLLEFAGRYSSPTRQFAAAALKSRFYVILYGKGKANARCILTVTIIALLIVGISYTILLQPAYQPEDADYWEYAIRGGDIEQVDGNLIFHTERGDFILSESEAAVIKQESFPVQNTERGVEP